MKLEELLKAKREEILRVCAKYGARNVRIFDSVARGAADEQSDVDLVVDFEPVRAKMEGRWRRGQPLPLPPGEGRHEGPAVCRDIPGFCKSSTLEEIRQRGYVLTPGCYVGAAEQQEEDEPFETKAGRLFARLEEQQPETVKLDAALTANLKEFGYGD